MVFPASSAIFSVTRCWAREGRKILGREREGERDGEKEGGERGKRKGEN